MSRQNIYTCQDNNDEIHEKTLNADKKSVKIGTMTKFIS